MGKLLGRPRTVAGAQLRLMLPVAVVSCFLNNTPVVAVMIPIVQRWAEVAQIPRSQVMIPLSFATILGGTCTLIGTSTNLVVLGMLNAWPGSGAEDEGGGGDKPHMGLFDVGLYGVPYALAGLAYIVVASPYLLPGGRVKGAALENGGQRSEDLLVGARVQPW
jgi:di/tricarboxylate transporter